MKHETTARQIRLANTTDFTHTISAMHRYVNKLLYSADYIFNTAIIIDPSHSFTLPTTLCSVLFCPFLYHTYQRHCNCFRMARTFTQINEMTLINIEHYGYLGAFFLVLFDICIIWEVYVLLFVWVVFQSYVSLIYHIII